MKKYELLRILRTAVHDSKALLVWSQAEYSQAHKVYLGFDTRNEPGADNCPMVVFLPAEKSSGMALGQKDYTFGVVCVVSDSATVTTGMSNAVEYQGISFMEDFQQLILDAMVAALPTGFRLDELQTEDYPIEAFPFFVTAMTCRVVEDYSQGDEVFD